MRLGEGDLLLGIPGDGELTAEAIEAWLADAKNHVVLKPELPLGLAAGAGEIKGIDENPLTRAVEYHEIARAGALGSRVLGMTSRVLIEARAVLQENVEEVLGCDELLEQETDGLLHRKRLASLRRENDAVLRF